MRMKDLIFSKQLNYLIINFNNFMGNSNSLNEIDRKLNSTRRKYNFLTTDQERELIELYKEFDIRNDPRFGRI